MWRGERSDSSENDGDKMVLLTGSTAMRWRRV